MQQLRTKKVVQSGGVKHKKMGVGAKLEYISLYKIVFYYYEGKNHHSKFLILTVFSTTNLTH